jgi:hypothetical protein
MSNDTNDQLVLISGFSATGKSASLRNIKNQEHWLYLNTEAGKRLPFRNSFQSYRIEDPYQIFEAFDAATAGDLGQIDGIIVDSITFMMDMLETQYVIPASDTQKAWGEFSQFFKTLMQQKVVAFAKPVIMIAHVLETFDEQAHEMKVKVPIKGGLKNNGIEAYFSTVVSTKNVRLKDLEGYKSDLLTIDEEEEDIGFKYVFQTRPTKATVGERMRSPMGMFSKSQTFMNNDAQMLLDHLHDFYG